jgi:hypothetical protein
MEGGAGDWISRMGESHSTDLAIPATTALHRTKTGSTTGREFSEGLKFGQKESFSSSNSVISGHLSCLTAGLL